MATTSQWWLKTIASGTISNLAAQFHALQNGPSIAGLTTESFFQAPISAAGNLLSLRVDLSTAPVGAANWKVEVSINGTPSGTLVVNLTGTDITATATGTVAVSAGDLLTIVITPTGSPAVANMQVAVEFDPTTANNYSYPTANGGNVAAASAPAFNRGLAAHSTYSTSTDSLGAVTKDIVPFDATITGYYVALSVAPGAAASGKAWDIILVRNGNEEATSALNIAETAKTGNVTGLTIAVAAGDELTFKVKTATLTPATTRFGWGITLVPTIAGQFWIGSATAAAEAATAVFLMQEGTGTAASNATEANIQLNLAPAVLRLTSLYVETTTAGGASKTRSYQQRVATGNGTLLATISGASALTGNDTGHTDSLTAGQLIDLAYTATALTASSSGTAWAVAATTAPPPAGPGGGEGGGKGKGGKGQGKGTPPPPPPAAHGGALAQGTVKRTDPWSTRGWNM